MRRRKAKVVPNLITPSKPIEIDRNVCIGCNTCVEACQMDVFLPNPAKGNPPVVVYPDECWYCGCCVKDCPLREEGAIKMNWPLMLKMRWKDKKTGEHSRFGMPNPPPPNPKPPVGGWDIIVEKRNKVEKRTAE